MTAEEIAKLREEVLGWEEDVKAERSQTEEAGLPEAEALEGVEAEKTQAGDLELPEVETLGDTVDIEAELEATSFWWSAEEGVFRADAAKMAETELKDSEAKVLALIQILALVMMLMVMVMVISLLQSCNTDEARAEAETRMKLAEAAEAEVIVYDTPDDTPEPADETGEVEEAEEPAEVVEEEPEDYYEPEPEPEADYYWDGAVLNAANGTVGGPSGTETYYNLPMGGVIEILQEAGIYADYWERDDGCKMYGDYIMIAADQSIPGRELGSILLTSRGWGMVCDTGTFIYDNPYQIDVAVNW